MGRIQEVHTSTLPIAEDYFRPAPKAARIVLTMPDFLKEFRVFKEAKAIKLRAKFLNSPYIWLVEPSPSQDQILGKRWSFDARSGEHYWDQKTFRAEDLLWIEIVRGPAKKVSVRR